MKQTLQDEDENLYNCFYSEDEVIEYIQNGFELEEQYKQKNNQIFLEP